ncbi:MAG: hypothetical protein RML84_11185, partial [Anaerolineae bacterium]|nr:hypothetical protein [Anaerolineae bacterium]MDW8293644.1 hypothetical protein [Anaerolineae bacterium]
MAFTVNDFEDLIRILKQNPEWQERMRQAILTPELLDLPKVVNQLVEAIRELTEAQRRSDARIDELAQTVAQLVEAQRRTDETVAQLVEAQRRSDARIDELAQTVAQLVAAQQQSEARIDQLTEIVQELVQISRDTLRRLERLENWQVGETGRRDGERFERETLARAPALFFGGRGGGAGEPHLREKVGDWLLPLYRQGVEVPPHDDPLLSDIIWWKGDRVMV